MIIVGKFNSLKTNIIMTVKLQRRIIYKMRLSKYRIIIKQIKKYFGCNLIVSYISKTPYQWRNGYRQLKIYILRLVLSNSKIL